MTDESLSENDVIWKPIIGFENYECTIDGQVRNAKTKKELKIRRKNRNWNYRLENNAELSRTKAIQLAFPETREIVNCLACNGQFLSGTNSNFNYCSNECKPKDKAAYAKLRMDKYKRVHGIVKKIRVRVVSTCYECGNTFEGKTKYCGVECQRAESIRNREAKTQERIKRIADHKCKTCECSLTNLRMEYCDGCRVISDREVRLSIRRKQRGQGLDDKGKARKRARKYGVLYEPVKPIDVFNKTKGKCHICKRKLNWEDRGKNIDTSPEVDHLWPMSKGGHHLFENLAIACRICNNNKSDNIFI